MSDITVSLGAGDLALRWNAASVRRNVLTLVEAGHRVILDASSVTSMAGSYADELWGLLYVDKGLDWIKTNVRLFGASEHVVRAAALAIYERRHSTPLKNTDERFAFCA